MGGTQTYTHPRKPENAFRVGRTKVTYGSPGGKPNAKRQAENWGMGTPTYTRPRKSENPFPVRRAKVTYGSPGSTGNKKRRNSRRKKSVKKCPTCGSYWRSVRRNRNGLPCEHDFHKLKVAMLDTGSHSDMEAVFYGDTY